MKTHTKRVIAFLLAIVTIITNIMVSVTAEETTEQPTETTSTKTLYRYREKIYTTSREELESPWILYDTTTNYEHTDMRSKIAAQDNADDMSFMYSACVHSQEFVNKYYKSFPVEFTDTFFMLLTRSLWLWMLYLPQDMCQMVKLIIVIHIVH